MVRHTLNILQQMLQDIEYVSDHFGKFCIKGLIHSSPDSLLSNLCYKDVFLMVEKLR